MKNKKPAKKKIKTPSSDAFNIKAFVSLAANPPKDSMDLLAIRITELSLLCGFRILEVLHLPADTLARDGESVGVKYLLQRKVKVNEYRIKPVPRAAIPNVERAINDINRICGPTRPLPITFVAYANRMAALLPGFKSHQVRYYSLTGQVDCL